MNAGPEGEKSTPPGQPKPAGEHEAPAAEQTPDPVHAANAEEKAPPGGEMVPASEAPTAEIAPAGEGAPDESGPRSVDPAKVSPTLRAVLDFLAKAPLEHNAHQRTPEELQYLARLADALGLSDALNRRPDALASLQELAEIARARGFFGDPDTGRPPASMRNPEEFDPLSLDERYGGEEYWRNEVDPDELRATEAELRDLGIADRLNDAAAAEAAAGRPALERNASRPRTSMPVCRWSRGRIRPTMRMPPRVP